MVPAVGLELLPEIRMTPETKLLLALIAAFPHAKPEILLKIVRRWRRHDPA